MTKTTEAVQFSNIVDLNLSSDLFGTGKYSADQSEFTIKYEDHLDFIKKYLSYEQDDHERKSFGLKCSECSFKTMKIPLEKDDFEYELEDDLFDQFLNQVQNMNSYNLLDNLDYSQTSTFNLLKGERAGPHFTFSLDFIKKTLSVKNDATLILGLLNVPFWFDLAILDLHLAFSYLLTYFRDYILIWLPLFLLVKFIQILSFCCKWLRIFEPLLYKNLKARKNAKRKARLF